MTILNYLNDKKFSTFWNSISFNLVSQSKILSSCVEDTEWTTGSGPVLHSWIRSIVQVGTLPVFYSYCLIIKQRLPLDYYVKLEQTRALMVSQQLVPNKIKKYLWPYLLRKSVRKKLTTDF
jgi:hypothetical protein